MINTIVAEAFKEACDEIEKSDNFAEAVHDLIKQYASDHYRIVFNGNGYSEAWIEEAKRRGLPVINSMVEAIPALTTDKAIRLFGEFGVFTEAELRSRAEIQYEAYAKTINIEVKAMLNIASKQIIPAVIKYTKSLADSINAVRAACDADISVQEDLLRETSRLLREAKTALVRLNEIEQEAINMEEGAVRANFYHDKAVPAMEALRRPVDELEMIVDKSVWPMPSYGDLLFEV